MSLPHSSQNQVIHGGWNGQGGAEDPSERNGILWRQQSEI